MTQEKQVLKNITASFDELVASFEAQTKAFQTQAQEAFKSISKNLFDLCPELTVVKWTQYTPYFNDGDECTFRVNSATFSNAPDPENVSTYGEYEGEHYVYEEGEDPEEDQVRVWLYGEDCYGDCDHDMPREYAKPFKAFERMLQDDSFEGVLKAMFGNHVKVSITRNGIDVSEYDHD